MIGSRKITNPCLMREAMPTKTSINLSDGESVSALVYAASAKKRAGVTMLLAHGAGANQASEFMVSFAKELSARGIDIVTFNFLYTEQGRRAPDRNDKLEACYRAAIAAVERHRSLGSNPLFIGGKSMGGRIASQVAASGVDDIAGLVFLGYPLHPPGKPERLRSEHLSLIRAPMLFVQGSRDPFGSPGELQPIIESLEPPAAIHTVEGGDHSFKVPKSSPISQAQIFQAAQDEIARWIKSLSH
jgi:predicted alpha/beta-hydrolase family hydrolase